MKKMILILLGSVCPFLFVNAQAGKAMPLHIGDTVPDIRIAGIQNYGRPDFSLRDFKGRLLILDFWSVGCTSCVGLMPVLDSLQRAYQDQLTVVSVTPDGPQKAQQFIHRFLHGKTEHLPVIYADTLLSALFPHEWVPHEVWIDDQGVVRAITGGTYARGKYIQRLLNDPQATLPLKQDFLGFNENRPLLTGGNGGREGNFLYRSMITPYLPGVNGGIGIHQTDSTVSLLALDVSIFHLYDACVPFNIIGNPKKVILHIRDSSRYFPPTDDPEARDAWRQKHAFCYQLILPSSKAAEIRGEGLEDLNRYFGLHADVEEVPTHCLAIVRSDRVLSLDRPLSRAAAPSHGGLQLVKRSMAQLRYYLDDISTLPLVFDETGYTGKVTLRLDADTSLAGLRKQLAPYGLRLVDTIRPVKKFILTENDIYHRTHSR